MRGFRAGVDRKNQKDPEKTELHQKRDTITCRYTTLDTPIYSITTAITLTCKIDFPLHQNPES